MQIKNLNGWHRLWVLASLIYLAFMVFIAVVDYPTPEKIFIADGEVRKNISTKTLEILAKPENTIVDPFDKKANRPTLDEIYNETIARSKNNDSSKEQTNISNQILEIITPKTGYSFVSPSDTEYIRKDYNSAVTRIINKKRISFIGTMIMAWLIPSLSVYALGLALNWVYRGFRTENK